MSTPVLPQNNLNGDAVPWARDVTKLTQANSRDIERLEMFQEMSNRANAGQMGVLGRQVAAIAAQNDFLVNQTGGIALVATRTLDRTPGQTTPKTFEPFDPEIDVELTFTTGASGRFISTATMVAYAYSASVMGTSARTTTGLEVEVLRDGIARGAGARLRLGSLSENGATNENSATVTGSFTFEGLPNQEYTLRTARYTQGNIGPSATGTRQYFTWSNLSISYTNLWN